MCAYFLEIYKRNVNFHLKVKGQYAKQSTPIVHFIIAFNNNSEHKERVDI